MAALWTCPHGDDHEPPGRSSGWIDLGRVKVSVEPALEWRQMFQEAWRLQRDQFWTEDMSSVDWQRVHELYLPLLVFAFALTVEMLARESTGPGLAPGGMAAVTVAERREATSSWNSRPRP